MTYYLTFCFMWTRKDKFYTFSDWTFFWHEPIFLNLFWIFNLIYKHILLRLKSIKLVFLIISSFAFNAFWLTKLNLYLFETIDTISGIISLFFNSQFCIQFYVTQNITSVNIHVFDLSKSFWSDLFACWLIY